LEKTGIFREHTSLQVRVLLPFHPIYQAIFLSQVYDPLIFRPVAVCQLAFRGASGLDGDGCVLREEEAVYRLANDGTRNGSKLAVVAGVSGGKGAKKGVRKEV
jgi:hypothetical protein